jgi:fibronectin type 3 domain-containing protein
VNAAGTSLNSTEVNGTPNTAPTTPTGLTATPGNAQVALSWTAVSGATSYNVQRSATSGGPYATVGTPTTNSFTNTGLTNGTMYYYVVAAVNSGGTSPNSTQVSGMPNAVPTAPTGLTATAGIAQVTLNWTAVTGATSYNVQRSTTSGGPYTTVGTPTTNSFTNTGLTNGTTYYYVVAAVNSAGTGPNSSQVSGTPAATGPPSCPPCFSIWSSTATPGTPDYADATPVELGVVFQTSTNGYIMGIRFYKGTNNTGTHIGNLWSRSGTLLATATFTGETASGWQQVNFATPVAITANTEYTASYFAPNGNFALDHNFFTSSGVSNPPLMALSDLAAPVGNGMYVYSSKSAFPTSTYSASNYWVDVVFQTTAPQGLKATVASNQVSLSWTAVSNATSYNVKRSTASGGPYTTVASPTTTTYTDATTTAGTTYYYVATAVTAQGESANSAEVAAIIPASVTPTCPTCFSIWSSSAKPGTPDNTSDTLPVELGVVFQPSTSGYITGIRFYKGSGNTGTHVANLWSSKGTLLATATFTGETASGWQQVNFSVPVPVTANTTYVASYFAPHGNYARDANSFASSGVTNSPLSALSNTQAVSNGEPGNGIYVYNSVSAFPVYTSGDAPNYWVDVVFHQ